MNTNEIKKLMIEIEQESLMTAQFFKLFNNKNGINQNMYKETLIQLKDLQLEIFKYGSSL